MTRLLVAEWKRLLVRRITRFVPLGLATLTIAGVVIAYLAYTLGEGGGPDFLLDIAGGEDAPNVLIAAPELLPVMAYVIGASYIGADSRTGVLEQILTWEPRRLRLVVARLVAVMVTTAVIAMVLSAFLVALLFGLSAAIGTIDGTTATLWGNVAVAIVRTAVASGLFAAFGLALTLVLDSSVGSIVGFLAYWFIIEDLVVIFLPDVGVYLPIINASGFASGRGAETIEGLFSGVPEVITAHGYLTSGAILLAWVVLSAVAATVVFERRDIAS